jgi:hypothetical protein
VLCFKANRALKTKHFNIFNGTGILTCVFLLKKGRENPDHDRLWVSEGFGEAYINQHTASVRPAR